MAAWMYPRTKGDKLYGRADNLGDRHARLHYGFGDGPDRPWRADETRLDPNPTNERATEEKERSGITTTGLWFGGPASGASFVRTKEVIDRSGDGGIILKMKIDRTELCSNHYIVLTEDPKYKFQFGPAAAQESGAIVIGFNCGNKVMYTSTGNSLEIPCLTRSTTEIRIKISSKGIIFEDDLKCPPLNLQGETTMSNQFYVYLGASQDTADPISTAERIARLQHIKMVGSQNNLTLDEEDLNDLKNEKEGPGRYKRSYFRDFSIIKIILPDKFDPETIVVGWGCNTKIAIGISGGQVIKKSNYCPHLGRHRISLDMISQPNHVIFRTVTEQEVQNTAEECDTGIGSLPPPEEEEEADGTTKTSIKMERLCPDLVLPSNFSKRGVYYIFSGAGTYPTSDQPMTRATVYESIAVDVPVSATRSMKIEDEETLSGTKVRNTELLFSDGFGSETENEIWMGE